MAKLIFVTGNKNKLAEVQAILSSGSQAIEIDSKSLDIDELQGTTQEVAIAKCKRAAELLQSPCITEDTALCFAALNGLPGPYIKHFMEGVGHAGLNKMLDGFSVNEGGRRAWALCTFAYCEGPGHQPILFEGRTDGIIVPARGSTHFGWDAVFEPLEQGEGGAERFTYAQMPPAQKNKISHRYKALEKLRAYLQEQTKAE